MGEFQNGNHSTAHGDQRAFGKKDTKEFKRRIDIWAIPTKQIYSVKPFFLHV